MPKHTRTNTRRFKVYFRDEAEHACTVEEASKEAAVAAFLERVPLREEHGDVAVIVLDLSHHDSSCYLINVDSGAVAPCR